MIIWYKHRFLLTIPLLLLSLAGYSQEGREIDSETTISFAERFKKDPNRAVWVELQGRSFQNDPVKLGELMIVGQTILKFERFGDKTKAEDIQSELNSNLDKFRQRAKALSDRSSFPVPQEKYLDAALEIGNAFGPKAAIGTSLGKMLKSFVVEHYKDLAAGDVQAGIQNQNAAMNRFGVVPDILEHLYDSGSKNKEIALALNRVLHNGTGPQIGENWKEQAKRKRTFLTEKVAEETNTTVKKLQEYEIQILDILIQNLGEDGKLKKGQKELKELTKKYNEEIASLMKDQFSSLEQILSTLEERRSEKERKIRSRQLEFDAAESVASGLSSTLAFVDPKLARDFGVSSSNILRLWKATERYKQALVDGDLTSGGLFIVGEMLSVFSGLISMAVDKKSSDEIIVEQLAAIQKQLINLGRYLQEQFERIDRQLYNIYYSSMKALDAIYAEVKDTQGRVRSIQENLHLLDRRLSFIGLSIENTLKELEEYRWGKNVIDCNNNKRLWNQELEFDAFKECMNRYYECATVGSQLDTFTGSQKLSSTLKEATQQINELLIVTPNSSNVFERTGTLTQAARLFGNQRLALEFKPSNPRLWSWCTHKFIDLAFKYPKHFSKMNHKDEKGAPISDLLAVGTLIQTSFNSIVDTKVKTDKEEIQFINALTRFYEIALESFLNSVAENRKVYVTSRGKGFDPWKYLQAKSELRNKRGDYAKTLSDDPNLSHGIPPCEGTSIPLARKVIRLRIPPNLERLIPLDYMLAHESGLGKIHLCYRDVRFTNIRTSNSGGFVAKKMRVYVTIKATYSDNKDKKQTVIFDRTITNKTDYSFGSRTPDGDGWWKNAEATIKKFNLIFGLEYHMSVFWNGEPDPQVKGDKGKPGGGAMMLDFAKESVDLGEIVKKDVAQNTYYFTPTSAHETGKKVQEARQKTFESFEKEMKSYFEGVATNIKQELVKDVREGELRTQASQLDAARRLLIAFVSLGWPQSMQRNDDLRALFFGKNGLPDSKQIVSLVNELEDFLFVHFIRDKKVFEKVYLPVSYDRRYCSGSKFDIKDGSVATFSGLSKHTRLPLLDVQLLKATFGKLQTKETKAIAELLKSLRKKDSETKLGDPFKVLETFLWVRLIAVTECLQELRKVRTSPEAYQLIDGTLTWLKLLRRVGTSG